MLHEANDAFVIPVRLSAVCAMRSRVFPSRVLRRRVALLCLFVLIGTPPLTGRINAQSGSTDEAVLWTLELKIGGDADPDVVLPVLLEVRACADGSQRHTVTVINGPEQIDAGLIEVEKGRSIVGFPHFDSQIELEGEFPAGSGPFTGTWSKYRGGENWARMPVVARLYQPGEWDDSNAFRGRWAVQFAGETDMAIGEFGPIGDNGSISGTFLTTTGDYRYLSGGVVDGVMQLACFDGAHAFLFRATIDDEGTMQGAFWSGNWYHTTWTAKRDDDVALPDGFSQAVFDSDTDLTKFRFRDSQSGEMAPVFKGAGNAQCHIIEIFGSWCPNCQDAAVYLKELDQKYAGRGLRITSLAFELGDDFERNARQIERYRERHQIEWPILIGGPSDKALASKAFPVIDRIRSYPTFIFLDANGAIVAVYSGFSGPATGPAHQRLRRRFEALIDRQLAGD